MLTKTLILGMGNTLLSDDGIGIIIKRNLEKIISDNNIDLVETSWGGFRIIDLLKDYDTAIIIDSIKTNQQPTGFIHRLQPNDLLHTLRLNSYHDINFMTALQLAKELNVKIPDEIHIFAAEISDNTTIAEQIDFKLWSTIEKCCHEIISLLQNKCLYTGIGFETDKINITSERLKELYYETADFKNI